MAAKKKKVDPIKQREKRTKIAAIVGLVILALAAAYEIPSMMKVMNKKAPAGSTYDPGPSLTPGGLPNVAGGTAAAVASTSGLVDTDVPPTSGAGQLVTFSVFETKNPFAPQVTESDSSAGSSTADTVTPSAADKAGADVPPAAVTTTPVTRPAGGATPPAAAAASTATSTTSTTTTVAPKPNVAISVNGAVSRVSSQGTFPRGAPVFRLVTWAKDSAQIAIVGGSYATGEGTLTLRVGESVTLQNQTDGKRYKLELLSTP
jgi:hypothetical protein